MPKRKSYDRKECAWPFWRAERIPVFPDHKAIPQLPSMPQRDTVCKSRLPRRIMDGGHAAGRAVLELTPRPTAVVAMNDLTGVGMINAFSEAGLRVPEDISVTGFDNTYLAEYFQPRLTTVDMHSEMLRRTPAQALHEASLSADTVGMEYKIAIDLVRGRSTGPAPCS